MIKRSHPRLSEFPELSNSILTLAELLLPCRDIICMPFIGSQLYKFNTSSVNNQYPRVLYYTSQLPTFISIFVGIVSWLVSSEA